MLALGGIDVILGVVWLETLGTITMDWKAMFMKFVHEGKPVQLQAHHQLTIPAILHSTVTDERHLTGSFLSVKMEVKDTKLPCSPRAELQQVLGKFVAVLAVVKGLPPLRTISHAIDLQYGAGPEGVCPYWYPHYQKDKIEKQIKNLLQQGVICNSTSAFSSPVVRAVGGACV